MSRGAKATVAQVNIYNKEVKEVKSLKVRDNMTLEGILMMSPGVDQQHINQGGSYPDQRCDRCFDVAELVPKQVFLQSTASSLRFCCEINTALYIFIFSMIIVVVVFFVVMSTGC